jgi:hypothetical protein
MPLRQKILHQSMVSKKPESQHNKKAARTPPKTTPLCAIIVAQPLMAVLWQLLSFS